MRKAAPSDAAGLGDAEPKDMECHFTENFGFAAVTAPFNFAGSTYFSSAHAIRFSGR